MNNATYHRVQMVEKLLEQALEAECRGVKLVAERREVQLKIRRYQQPTRPAVVRDGVRWVRKPQTALEWLFGIRKFVPVDSAEAMRTYGTAWQELRDKLATLDIQLQDAHDRLHASLDTLNAFGIHAETAYEAKKTFEEEGRGRSLAEADAKVQLLEFDFAREAEKHRGKEQSLHQRFLDLQSEIHYKVRHRNAALEQKKEQAVIARYDAELLTLRGERDHVRAMLDHLRFQWPARRTMNETLRAIQSLKEEETLVVNQLRDEPELLELARAGYRQRQKELLDPEDE